MKPNSWSVIREAFTKGTTPQSTGYYVALYRATQLFVKLRDSGMVKDNKRATDAFNADKEVFKAIVNRPHFIEMGLLHD